MAEEGDSSDETWGKTSALSRGLAMQKESQRGMVKWWLAGGGDSPLCWGKSWRGGKIFGRRSLL
jgi:hypothetical protein